MQMKTGAIMVSLVALATAGMYTAAPAAPGLGGGSDPAGQLRVPAAAGRLGWGEQRACPVPSRSGQMECMLISAAAVGGYAPAQLRSAYGIAKASIRRGRGETIAVVDAGGNPAAAAYLSVYRKQFGLRPCTVASGCLRIVNERGRPFPLPAPQPGWQLEESTDLEMVSAICPNCRILLVEAANDYVNSMGIAEDTATTLGARFISDSWSGSEFVGQQAFDHYFNHPGDAVVAASGDYGYGPSYPADTQYVTSVGGTTLRSALNRRGWRETAWGGTGSGCSTLEPKPSWQRFDATSPDGCLNRTQNDLAAVANPATGVAVYSGLWRVAGGTSVATPIIAAMYALAGNPARDTYPASYPYLQPDFFHHITGGSNGSCETYRRYLCTAVAGYNGPTGVGTPDGIAGLSDNGAHLITLLDPGTQDLLAGTRVALLIRGLDSQAGRRLSYVASGLPAGLRISAVPSTPDARIIGTLPAAPRTYDVVVDATDGTVTGRISFWLVGAAPLAAAEAPAGPVQLASTGQCLTAAKASGRKVSIQPCGRSAPGQNWSWSAGNAPWSTGALTIGGLCLTLSRAGGDLHHCARQAPGQQLLFLGFGEFENPVSGECLGVPSATRSAGVSLQECSSSTDQAWTIPAAPITSGLPGLCLASVGQGHLATTQACSGDSDHRWTWLYSGQIELGHSGLCLLANGALDQVPAQLSTCNSSYAQTWYTGPGSELINGNSGLCLADLDGARPTASLVQDDCYGRLGEIWSAN
jgi:hypothetical protein